MKKLKFKPLSEHERIANIESKLRQHSSLIETILEKLEAMMAEGETAEAPSASAAPQRPVLPSRGNRQFRGFRLDPDVYEWLRLKAFVERRSQADIVNEILREIMNKEAPPHAVRS